MNLKMILQLAVLGTGISLGSLHAQPVADTLARDTSGRRGSLNLRPRWTITGGAAYLTSAIDAEYRYDPRLQEVRAERDAMYGLEDLPDIGTGSAYGPVGDNPLMHLAFWNNISATVEPLHGIAVTGGVRTEWRGASYGASNTSNMIVQPAISLLIDTAVRLGGERFGVAGRIGDLGDVRLDEGLTLYNIEAQGLISHIDWRRLRLGMARIADGVATIGLNTDDFVHLSLALHQIPLTDEWNTTISLLRKLYGTVKAYPEPEFTKRGGVYARAEPGDDFLGVALRVQREDSSLALYAEGGLRDASGDAGILSRSGLVAGAETLFRGNGWRMSLQGEFRFYGGLFNANYRNDDVYYRDPGQNTQYGVGFRGYYAFGNTVGPALYRLSWYDRPFSQWATYTEYQGLMDVTAGTLRAVVWYDIGHDCEIGVTADIATIATASIGVVTAFTYAFVDLGLRWRPVAGFSIGASITNRGMNLNLNHPTLAQLTEPTLLFGSHWDISW